MCNAYIGRKSVYFTRTEVSLRAALEWSRWNWGLRMTTSERGYTVCSRHVLQQAVVSSSQTEDGGVVAAVHGSGLGPSGFVGPSGRIELILTEKYPHFPFYLVNLHKLSAIDCLTPYC